ncbi:myelin and lymphocyte protein isoform X3 [Chelonia mydas]|uniref:myelin and lymphocyte protein isoform X3 n=1 Tax=Chelonia mydas TaxID=8469 RepID=UPI001CA96263|nr:myelin and lymphocyte protein isoform X3 [Chelonia mydas]
MTKPLTLGIDPALEPDCELPATPISGLWRPCLDSGGVYQGSCALTARLGYVCFRVLLHIVNSSHVPLFLRRSWWKIFLDCSGCFLSFNGCSVLPECRCFTSLCHLCSPWRRIENLPGRHCSSGICIFSHLNVRDS